jgi:limonene-1,2-epoxide hydrolase
MSDSNIEIVDGFVAAFNANDVESIMSFFTDDAIYHNMPAAPLSGIDAIRTTIAGYMGMATDVDWIVHNSAAAADGVVLNERSDRFLINGTWIELPVMGAFEIRDGKIAKWRDYFDMNQFQTQIASASAA